MKKLLPVLLFIVGVITRVSGQGISENKFAANELKADLAYLKQQLYTVHVYPYTEFSKTEYDQLFDKINSRLTDSLPATGFLKMIKPVIAHLCDEHAQVYLPDKQLWKSYREEAVFLPVTLSRKGNTYYIEKVLSIQNGLKRGENVAAIDNVPIGNLIKQCALFSSGYPEQRVEKTLQQFGYLYTWMLPTVRHEYKITKANGKSIMIPGVTLKIWQDELNRQTGWDAACDEKIAYQKINNVGYITACSFNIAGKQLDSISTVIDKIFEQVHKDNPKYLFIDVSKNSGGQSRVGQMLIDGFYNKPYRGFGQDFKKSEAYIKLLKSWKIEADDYYKDAPEGKVFHFQPDSIFPGNNSNHYKGKVFLIVGNGTFSSAMMMAAWIKDNHIATIAGETPMLGHPNGFGELYNTQLPNTKINLLFGVKRWIRPSGNLKDNLLRPDIRVKLTDNKEELIQSILNRSR